jgi:hypothetical protein
MKRNALTVMIVIACVIGGILFFQNTQSSHDPSHVHYHAGFVVYMHVDMCSIAEKQKEHNLKQVDRVHLHDNVGDVAHIHADGVLWKELFENSSIILPSNKKLVAFQNGNTTIENVLNKKIEPYESIILVYGEEIEIESSLFVTRERIEEVESKPSGCDL